MAVSFSQSHAASGRAPGSGVTAVLGPTNTGKTHLAIERMLGHSSGIIGLPLRLLAREVYNKVVARVGAADVALITGEEKIKPPHARFWVSTVEAMPRELDVAFLAVDEIQIGADLERGHVFTDRLLNRRGRDETLLLGAATMRPVIEKLLPGANIITRPRLSQLSFAGDRKITRQPRRTAIVAFSADEVYAIAELIRRQHGGAAVVLGSLSPRTRNAQVDLFQSGDVDFLVATDAIGMGLNLDVDHVAFASDRKYDGYQFRRLTPSEFAQIAGRAGRATRDGTFGTTGRCEPFESELVDALQNHAFDSVKLLQWRNSKLDMSSLGALQVSLAQAPNHECLTRAPIAEDLRVLDHAARDAEVRDLAQGAVAVERLWETCQVPDYRKLAPAAHAELVTTLFGFLMRRGRIPDDWFAAQVALADRTDGGIDTLSARIAQIRTWTFAANRPDWLADPEHWQGISRAVEDKLSDALHERLTERFVDRRTSVLMRRLRENTMLNTEIGKTGEVVVEGHVIGRLDGFMFAPDAAEAGSEAKALQAAALKALAGEIDARAERLSQAPDEQFVLASDGTLRWTGDAVAKLVAADDMLHPRLRIIADERLTGAPRDAVQARLDLWLKTHIEKLLGPLFEITKAEDITGIARGIAFQLVEALGVLERQRIAAEMKDLDQPSRASLRKYGVRFGAYHVYVPGLLKPAARAMASLLWALKQDNVDLSALSSVQHLAASGRTSFPVDNSLSRDAYRVLGYRQCGERAVRVDILERLADLIRPALAWREASPGPKPPGAFDGRGFTVTQAMTSLTGSAGEDFAAILRALGYRMEKRPPPAPAPVPEPSTTEAAAPEAAVVPEAIASEAVAPEAIASESAASESAAVETPAPTGDASATTVVESGAEQTSVGEAAEAEVVDAAPAETGVEPAAAEVAGAPEPEAAEAAPPAEASAAEAALAETAGEAAAVEPQLVEVWRPGGRSEERRPRHERPHGRRGQGGAPAAAGEAGEAREQRHGHGQGRRDRRDEFRKLRAEGAGATAGEAREPRERDERKGGGFKGKPRNGSRPEGRPPHGHRHERHSQNAPPRERPIDPNSPFAKLAALKEQLTNRKDG
ncbi:helicase-related protein [Bradyrhizobium sp. WD16]|uniref:helicase-related protein n=1 Tax=Bradyrhizobium sp. WD16 TaxID=1521768 RepID=UPI0020A4FCFC|nr:helicase-related protein [Bradyrhizobium sp. WD16]UTD26679.1 helicase [Bradyrhizobium sp. WD16]